MATLDIQSAYALLIVAKKHLIVDIMLTLFKEEVTAFGQVSIDWYGFPDQSMPPANQCTTLVRGERCRGVTSELSVTQRCTRCTFGERCMHRTRCFFRDDAPDCPWASGKWHPDRYALAGLPREQWAAQQHMEREQ